MSEIEEKERGRVIDPRPFNLSMPADPRGCSLAHKPDHILLPWAFVLSQYPRFPYSVADYLLVT